MERFSLFVFPSIQEKFDIQALNKVAEKLEFANRY